MQRPEWFLVSPKNKGRDWDFIGKGKCYIKCFETKFIKLQVVSALLGKTSLKAMGGYFSSWACETVHGAGTLCPECFFPGFLDSDLLGYDRNNSNSYNQVLQCLNSCVLAFVTGRLMALQRSQILIPGICKCYLVRKRESL